MGNLNKVQIIGRLGKDPEIRHTQSGDAVANLTIATSEKWKDKTSGQQQEKTEWHRVVMFKNLAKLAGDYLSKGSEIYIEGKLTTRKWQDQQGQDRYSTEIVAKEMQFLGSKNDNQDDGRQTTPSPASMNQQSNPSQQQVNQNTHNHMQQKQNGYQNQQQNHNQAPQQRNQQNDFNEDIPF